MCRGILDHCKRDRALAEELRGWRSIEPQHVSRDEVGVELEALVGFPLARPYRLDNLTSQSAGREKGEGAASQ